MQRAALAVIEALHSLAALAPAALWGWLAAIGVMAALLVWGTLRLGRRATDGQWLPAELAGAQLAFSERAFVASMGGFKLGARPDRVYRLASGVCVLVEFKTRAHARVYESDVVELSAQATVLRSLGQTVSTSAWVVVIDPASETYRPTRVLLESDGQVRARALRWLAVRQGRLPATGARAGAVCRGCGHRAECPQRLVP